MTARDRRMRELAALAALIREGHLGALAQARAAQLAIEAEVAALDAGTAALSAAAPEAIDPGALARHHAWRLAERRALMMRLAQARVACDLAVTRAVPAVGRADVLRQLSGGPIRR